MTNKRAESRRTNLTRRLSDAAYGAQPCDGRLCFPAKLLSPTLRDVASATRQNCTPSGLVTLRRRSHLRGGFWSVQALYTM